MVPTATRAYRVRRGFGNLRPFSTSQISKSDIHQMAAESFANLPRFRVLGNPAPLARAVDGDGTSRRHAER
jgi:hypothetical protein